MNSLTIEAFFIWNRYGSATLLPIYNMYLGFEQVTGFAVFILQRLQCIWMSPMTIIIDIFFVLLRKYSIHFSRLSKYALRMVRSRVEISLIVNYCSFCRAILLMYHEKSVGRHRPQLTYGVHLRSYCR